MTRRQAAGLLSQLLLPCVRVPCFAFQGQPHLENKYICRREPCTHARCLFNNCTHPCPVHMSLHPPPPVAGRIPGGARAARHARDAEPGRGGTPAAACQHLVHVRARWGQGAARLGAFWRHSAQHHWRPPSPTAHANTDWPRNTPACAASHTQVPKAAWPGGSTGQGP